MQPKGAPIDLYKCPLCLKIYATDDHLKNHFRKRHPDFYKAEMDKENSDLLNMISEQAKDAQMNEDKLVDKLKTEVMNTFGPEFYKIQKELEEVDQAAEITQKVEQCI